MLKRTSTPLNENRSIDFQSKKTSVRIPIDSKDDNIDDLIRQGKNMNEREFEEFIQVHASDSYWRVLAERARLELEDQLRDNRQLHELLDVLRKENEQLQMKNEQCEYLSNVFNSILSEYDSGIGLHTNEESSGSN